MPDSRPLGIFDSGVGGLTVFSAISARLPNEPVVYLGDTARVPYGTKSHDTVERYARACAKQLTDRGVKLLVVACNTASAHALDVLERELPLPVIGVIGPGAQAAVAQSRSGRIGVLGTHGTVASGAYERTIRALDPGASVFCKACPLFVPLAEEGWTTGEVPEAIAREYLGELLENEIDVLVLGCTHYPLLAGTIQRVAGGGVTIVDSAAETAAQVERLLQEQSLSAAPGAQAHQFLVTDAPENFQRAGAQFLGKPLHNVEWVDF